MSEPPPLMRDQRKVDADHLKLLAIFHFVLAGLSILGFGFLFVHYAVMHAILTNPGFWKNQKVEPFPVEFFSIFQWFYLFFGAVLLIALLTNLISGLFILRRRHRFFSLVVAGFDCLQFPFGTALGVFTIVVLLRDSVREVYEGRTS